MVPGQLGLSGQTAANPVEEVCIPNIGHAATLTQIAKESSVLDRICLKNLVISIAVKVRLI